MLILLAAAALTTPDPVPPRATPAHCAPAADKAAASGRASVRKLGELPPGQQIKAVWRFDEKGCPSPIVVRSQVGVNGR